MGKAHGVIRLPALPAPDVWQARNKLSLWATAPLSIVTVTLDGGDLGFGDVAGLALMTKPYAWLGVERVSDGLVLAQFDEQRGTTSRRPLGHQRVWLRVTCDFAGRQALFHYSADGARYAAAGEPYVMGDGPAPAQAITCSLFCCSTKTGVEGGHAGFDSFMLDTGRTRHQSGLG